MFYVYYHLRLDNNIPFYIGKGCIERLIFIPKI